MNLTENMHFGVGQINLKPDNRLLLTTLLSSITAIFFLIFFSFLLAYGHSLSAHKIVLGTMGALTLASYLATIGLSVYFFYYENSKTEELKERAKFAYLWAIYAGFLFFTPFIVYYVFRLSSEDLKYLEQAKEEYENNIAYDLYKKAALKKNAFKAALVSQLEETIELHQNNFITEVERNSYLQRLLKDNTDIFKKIDYSSQEVMKKIEEIIFNFK